MADQELNDKRIESGNFIFTRTPIDGVLVVDVKRFPDRRGWFSETYKKCDFIVGGITDDFVQENQSYSVKGVVRGLHYQRAHPQSKLVRVPLGEAFDVAVDLRPNSPTFLRWHGEVLSEDNGRQLYVPRGCAHGIMILSDEAVFCYKADDVFNAEDEAGIIWNDEIVSIEWPLGPSEAILSDKDMVLPSAREAFKTRDVRK